MSLKLGFRAEVANFQPFYGFNSTPKNMDNLRIGAAVLREALDRNTQKMEQAKLNRIDPKAVQREIALKVRPTSRQQTHLKGNHSRSN